EDTGNDAGASTTRVANAMIQHVEVLKNFKLEIPLGLKTNSDPLPNMVESPYAGLSSQLIIANLDAIEKTFTGGEGQGFDDYLNQLDISSSDDENLTDAILLKIDQCRSLAQGIDDLSEAVATRQKQSLDLLQSLKDLTTLMKADMMSQLGIILTFSSNDGDS
ncbi:MAG: imelysin family protein, partial [Bacteroidota bacterium]